MEKDIQGGMTIVVRVIETGVEVETDTGAIGMTIDIDRIVTDRRLALAHARVLLVEEVIDLTVTAHTLTRVLARAQETDTTDVTVDRAINVFLDLLTLTPQEEVWSHQDYTVEDVLVFQGLTERNP